MPREFNSARTYKHSASRGPSAIAELLVNLPTLFTYCCYTTLGLGKHYLLCWARQCARTPRTSDNQATSAWNSKINNSSLLTSE